MDNLIPKNNILQRLWTGKCSISEYKSITDPNTHQTTQGWAPVVENEPCRLSYSNEKVSDVKTGIPSVSQIIKLFIRPDLTIKVGSRIEITQNRVTSKFKRSGKPAAYTNHQEVILQLDEDV